MLVFCQSAKLSAATLPLAEQGRALEPIVIAEEASTTTRQTAAELASYLKRITGATFEIQTGDGASGIVLGTLADFPNPALVEPLAIRNGHDGREAFAIRTEPERLLLIGATDLGVSHAASRLLESLGCRWFFPAPEWEVVPIQPTLGVSLDETARPRFLSRRINYGYGVFNEPRRSQGRSAIDDYQAWLRHNRLGQSLTIATSHAWQAIIIANQQLFNEHPEYLALVKGERRKPQLCVSSPAVRRLAVEFALKKFRDHPETEMVSMECSDGLNQCECDDCAKLGAVSDRVFGLANDVAREVARQFPGKMVGCLAYGEHSPPPSFALEDNVYVQLTAGFTRGPFTFDELVELWSKQCRHLGFYEYYSVWPWDFDELPGGKVADITRVRQSLRRYAEVGATSVLAESGNNWGLHGRGYYIAGKLMWDTDADVDALLADFYQKAFGPAAAAMQRYYERIAPDDDPLLSRGLVGEALRDVEEASRQARDLPAVQARLDQLKHYLRYEHLRWLLDHERDATRRKELSLAILELTYRTRYEHMNHWAALRYSFAGDAAKEFNEPSWRREDRSPKPWQNDTPVSKAETEAWFQQALDYFQPTPAREVAFDLNKLAPSGLTGAKPVASTFSFQRPERLALASLHGEPLVVEITTRVIAAYGDRADARYTLTDQDGKTIASGRLPLDGQMHQVMMEVPAAGVYQFQFDDSGAGWRIACSAQRPITWLAQRGRRSHPLGQLPELYFYVPKGAKQVQLFYSGRPMKWLGPDRQPIATVDVSDEIVTIDVPPGKDGACWSMAPHGQSQLWFLNLPNCLAASPEALLLPSDLLKRDERGGAATNN
jgi:hypothetical protein